MRVNPPPGWLKGDDDLPKALVKETDPGCPELYCPTCGWNCADYVMQTADGTIYRCKRLTCQTLYIARKAP